MPLFTAAKLGILELPNRIVMSAMTRSRAPEAGIPTDLTATYYSQRATAGLMVTGSVTIAPEAAGYLWTEGIYSDPQIAGWRRVTEAVHGAGGRIAVQLIHCGRVSHSSLQPDRSAPPGVSDIAADAEVFALTAGGTPSMVACSPPRPLATAEIEGIIESYITAARNARTAGFDAIEIQGGNGFLVEQFLTPAVNSRTDHYGQPSTFLLEVVDAVAAAVPDIDLGVKLTPGGVVNGITPAIDWPAANLRLLRELSSRDVAFVTLADQAAVGAPGGYDATFATDARAAFDGTLVLGGGYTAETATTAIVEGRADLIAFGRPFLANPDLPARLRARRPLADPDPATFYGGGAEGYTDYPAAPHA